MVNKTSKSHLTCQIIKLRIKTLEYLSVINNKSKSKQQIRHINDLKEFSLTRPATIIAPEEAVKSNGRRLLIHEEEQIIMEEATGCQVPRHLEVMHSYNCRKIETSKQFITNEAKRTNDTLLAFQHKF